MVNSQTGPLLAAGRLLGLGLGGFLDGIFLHQILQWHQMISAILPPDSLEASKVNMFWDGIFHLGTWTFTVAGVVLLWRVRNDPGGSVSTRLLFGAVVFGWGLFNFLDSVFNHYLFGLHNVREAVENPVAWNAGFLVFSLIQMGVGGMVVHHARRMYFKIVSPDSMPSHPRQ